MSALSAGELPGSTSEHVDESTVFFSTVGLGSVPFGSDGSAVLFNFDLALSCTEGEAVSFVLTPSGSSGQISVGIGGETYSIVDGANPMGAAGATLVCAISGEVSPTPTPSWTPETSVTNTPVSAKAQVEIDLDRQEPGIQASVVVGSENAFLLGSVILTGLSPEDLVGPSYGIGIRLVGEGEIDPTQSNLHPGDATGGSSEFLGLHSFFRGDVFINSVSPRSDGTFVLFEFDLAFSCDFGRSLSFEFISTGESASVGVGLNGQTYSIGSGFRTLAARGGAVNCEIPTPTSTSTPTRTEAPLPTLTPRQEVRLPPG